MKTGLTERLEVDLYNNPSKSGGSNREWEFWSRVGKEHIYLAYHEYKLDFDMFGYSAREYLEGLGLSEKVDYSVDESSLFGIN